MAWNGVDRKMPRFPTLGQVSDRVHFALLTRPFPPRVFHPLFIPPPLFFFFTSESVEESTEPSLDVWNFYIILRIVVRLSLRNETNGLGLISAR